MSCTWKHDRKGEKVILTEAWVCQVHGNMTGKVKWPHSGVGVSLAQIYDRKGEVASTVGWGCH